MPTAPYGTEICSMAVVKKEIKCNGDEVSEEYVWSKTFSWPSRAECVNVIWTPREWRRISWFAKVKRERSVIQTLKEKAS